MNHLTRLIAVLGLILPVSAWAQLPNPTGVLAPPPAPAPVVQKLSDTTFRIGPMRVDTAAKEVSVAAKFNDVMVLEFLANARNGAKAYESALTVDVDAVTFNTALLLIGLDPARSKPSKRQFDPDTPEGDPVEMYVSWGDKRLRIEELILDRRSNRTLPARTWVYTGSTFILDTENRRRYMAELDGVLIGFMHSPSAIIENPRNDALGVYGQLVLNTALGFPADGAVTLTIKALPRTAAR